MNQSIDYNQFKQEESPMSELASPTKKEASIAVTSIKSENIEIENVSFESHDPLPPVPLLNVKI